MPDDHLKEILNIINKRFSKDINIDDYECIELLHRESNTQFQVFLLNARVRPFLKLKILYHFCDDSSFVIGDGKLSFTRGYDEHDTEKKELGPSIIDAQFSKKNIFDLILGRMGFLALMIRHSPRLEGQARTGEEGTIELEGRDEGWQEYAEDEVIVMTDPDSRFIFTDSHVYIDADDTTKKKVKDLIDSHIDTFNTFLDDYKERNVPHELYVDWLMKWFPGKIEVKSIE